MGKAKQYSGKGSFLSAQKIAERWAGHGFLAVVARTEEGLYVASQWEPSVFIDVFRRDPDEIEQATALNKEFGAPPPANLLSTGNMEIYLADNIWLDEDGWVCEGVPNDFVYTCYANDIEAIQTFFGLVK